MRRWFAFTLIEVLVVIAIIGVLVTLLVPALSRARGVAKSAICLTRLRTLGQGFMLYAGENKEVMLPARMPGLDDNHWRIRIEGGLKYRPSFLAMMASQVGLKPFDEPLASRKEVDSFGQPGDRQNYASEAYVCPETREWTDERNGSYGYNYQFLGNARLRNPANANSYKNWPVTISRIRSPSECLAMADAMGTAASFPRYHRGPYQDNEWGDSRSGREKSAHGNEGFNLDPPRVDPHDGEMAGLEEQLRTAVHARHNEKGNVLWADAHASTDSLESLGYLTEESGVIGFEGQNKLFSLDRNDEAWTED